MESKKYWFIFYNTDQDIYTSETNFLVFSDNFFDVKDANYKCLHDVDSTCICDKTFESILKPRIW